jgi:hypothetical protein
MAGGQMRKCVELRRVRRALRMQRLLPGLAAMGGLFGVSVPLVVPDYDLDAEWIEFSAGQAWTGQPAIEDAAG